MSGNVVMARNQEGPGAEYTGSKNMQGKKKKATFECQSCTRKFATRSHLVRHSRVHTGERRYACDYPGCEMRCSRKDNLQQHYRTHLVVNPRRANAQSILAGGGNGGPSHEMEPESATTDMTHDFASPDKMTSPTDLKPIIAGNTAISLDQPHQQQPLAESHAIAFNGNAVHHQHHPAIGGPSMTTTGDENGPERDWSISPPPPLSSAYDYWYAHGCLPQAARNPASVSGSGSSGATSPEISNALELAPGQIPRAYVDSPTTYYHHPPPPLGSSLHSTSLNGYASYDGAAAAADVAAGQQRSGGFPLATATFPTAAEYQHPAATSHSHHPAHHQRSHSHSYSIGGNSSAGGYPTARIGYQSASTSPHLSHSHLQQQQQQQHPANGIHHPHQGRHHSYSADSYDATGSASYPANGPRSLTAAALPGIQGGYHGPSSNGSPTDRFTQSGGFHGHHPGHHHHPGHAHSHSHSGSSQTFQPMTTNGRMSSAREAGDHSRPVTRHGSISSTPQQPQQQQQYSMPVYPSHPGMNGYAVPVEMTQSVSVASSPRMASTQQSPSLVLPPIRYADSEQQQQQQQQQTAYGMMGGMGAHFSSGSPWDRVSVSDARALPPNAGAAGMTR